LETSPARPKEPTVPITLEYLQDAVRQWAAQVHPGRTALRLVIVFTDQEQVRLLLPPPGPIAAEQPPAELRQQILQTLADADRPLKSSAVAARAGRKFDGHFRRVMKQLREAGEIHQDDAGNYSLPDDPTEE
jgi:hypothetical protein